MRGKPWIRLPARAGRTRFASVVRHARGTLVLLLCAVLFGACASGSPRETAAPGSTEPAPSAEPAPNAESAPGSATASRPAPPPNEGPPAESPPPAEAPPAAVHAIFTDVQASRGRDTFDQACSDCHTNSEFRGGAFQRNWGRRTVYSFYRTVRSTMPDDNPGGLDEEVYLDVVSYILRMNGHAPGASELTADSPMREVRMAPTEGGS